MGCSPNKKFWIGPCPLPPPHKASVGITSILVKCPRFSSGIQNYTVNTT